MYVCVSQRNTGRSNRNSSKTERRKIRAPAAVTQPSFIVPALCKILGGKWVLREITAKVHKPVVFLYLSRPAERLELLVWRSEPLLISLPALTEDKVFEEPQNAHRLSILWPESGNVYEVIYLFGLSGESKCCPVTLRFSLQTGPERSWAACWAETFGLTCQCDVMLEYGENSFCFIDKSFLTLMIPVFNLYNIY